MNSRSEWIYTLSLTAPSLDDNTADVDRLISAVQQKRCVKTVSMDFTLAKKLPQILRNAGYNVDCVVFNDRSESVILDVISVENTRRVLGLAVDLGTTRVVTRLMDLYSGQVLIESTFDNPQLSVGPDILTRIHHADTQKGEQHLHQLILDALNRHIENILHTCSLQADSLYAVSVAGNTTMTHLFLGLPPRHIIREPYIPVMNTPQVVRARDLGIAANPSARVLVFPNVGSYFGGDLIAGILHADIHNHEKTTLLVDVGTNAEVLVGNRQWLIACAGAAGPALEGGATQMGMLAGPGVIDRVRISSKTRNIDIHTIENGPPKGICGSGLIDLAAQLFRSGMIDIRGKFVPHACGRKLVEIEQLAHLVIVPASLSASGSNLTISQADLDSLIRSKAAMYTILNTITRSVGVTWSDIDTFYIAGTFGAYIDPESAITIGMIPDLPRERFVSLGNSSLEGATCALRDNRRLDEIDAIRSQVTYLELNVNQAFMARFSAAKFLPHTDKSRFPSVQVPDA
ncbi:MAG: DUF4445 domain-containing protein [Deltaproteobacteria bacterium]|nr:DUF4445 domain-containing protein [Deltaproteobacteria bacterium]